MAQTNCTHEGYNIIVGILTITCIDCDKRFDLLLLPEREKHGRYTTTEKRIKYTELKQRLAEFGFKNPDNIIIKPEPGSDKYESDDCST